MKKYLAKNVNHLLDDKQDEFIKKEINNGKLVGISGTGKTYCINEKIKYFIEMNILHSKNFWIILHSNKKIEQFKKFNRKIYTKDNVLSIFTIAKNITKTKSKTIDDVLVYKSIELLDEYSKAVDIKLIIIDEAELLTEIQYRFLSEFQQKSHCYVILVGDLHGNIFQYQNSSNRFLLNHNGYTIHLTKVFRKSSEIINLIDKFVPCNYDIFLNESRFDNKIRGSSSELQNNELHVTIFESSYEILCKFIIDFCKNYDQEKSLAIISPTKTSNRINGHYLNLGLNDLSEELTRNEVKFYKLYETETELSEKYSKIYLSTIHSSKGYEFDTVLIINFHLYSMNRCPETNEIYYLKCLWYNAISRATEFVSLFKLKDCIPFTLYDRITWNIKEIELEQERELDHSLISLEQDTLTQENDELDEIVHNFVFKEIDIDNLSYKNTYYHLIDIQKKYKLDKVIDLLLPQNYDYLKQIFLKFINNEIHTEDTLYKFDTKKRAENTLLRMFCVSNLEYLQMNETVYIKKLKYMINHYIIIPHNHISDFLYFNSIYNTIVTYNDLLQFHCTYNTCMKLITYIKTEMKKMESVFLDNDQFMLIPYDKTHLLTNLQAYLSHIEKKEQLTFEDIYHSCYHFYTILNTTLSYTINHIDIQTLQNYYETVKLISLELQESDCFHKEVLNPFLDITSSIDTVCEKTKTAFKILLSNHSKLSELIEAFVSYEFLLCNNTDRNNYKLVIFIMESTCNKFSKITGSLQRISNEERFKIHDILRTTIKQKFTNAVFAYDLETTGLINDKNMPKIMEIHVEEIKSNLIPISTFIKINDTFDYNEELIESITGISRKICKMEGISEEIFKKKLNTFLESMNHSCVLIAHNGHQFDHKILRSYYPSKYHNFQFLDSLHIFPHFMEEKKKNRLEDIYKRISNDHNYIQSHRAKDDVHMLCYIYNTILPDNIHQFTMRKYFS